MPRVVDHEDRRRKICDVLLDVIGDGGIEAATIREVANRSRWSTGVITYYFKTRELLLLGGLRRAADVLAEYNTRVLSNLDGLQALEQLLEGSIPLDTRRVALCRIFFFFYVEGMRVEAFRLEVESYLSGWRKAVARSIRRAQKSGDLPASLDYLQLTDDLAGMADGLSMHALLDPALMSRLRERSPVRFWIRCLATQPKGAGVAAAQSALSSIA